MSRPWDNEPEPMHAYYGHDDYEPKETDRYYQGQRRIARERFDECDAGRCQGCGRIIPHEDEVYCVSCDLEASGVSDE